MFSRNKSLNQSIAHLPRWREAMKRERESPLNVRNLYACNAVPPPVMLLNPMNELFGYIMLHHLKHGDSVTHIFYDRFFEKTGHCQRPARNQLRSIMSYMHVERMMSTPVAPVHPMARSSLGAWGPLCRMLNFIKHGDVTQRNNPVILYALFIYIYVFLSVFICFYMDKSSQLQVATSPK